MRLLLGIFFTVYSSAILAVIADISGTYSGTDQTSNECSSWGASTSSDSVPELIITQNGLNFIAIRNFSHADAAGFTEFSGTVDSSNSISGKILQQYFSNDSGYGFGEGTFSGNFDIENNQLIINSIINNFEHYSKDNLLEDTCSYVTKWTLNRTSLSAASVSASVQSTTGQTFSITPVTIELPAATVPDTSVLLTLVDSTIIIKRVDGSIFEIKQNSVVTLNPFSTISLIRGQVTATVDCNYEVHTALANIISCPATKKGADAAKFTTNYSQSDLDGTLIVSVETGSVDIIDREGNTFVVSAGEEKTITNRVPRTQWVLPVDEDKLYGGENNFLIWTQFPNAVSYQMEFNLPTPDFSEQNASTPQFTKQVIPLTAGSYVEFEELALLNLPLPKGADGLVLELRIFALDSSGNIIGESVSSDSISVTVTN
jgi:hypothetical protein